MARVKIETQESYSFSCTIPVRITDINYGGHVGNDTILSIIHEARMQYFNQLGYSEMNVEGTGLIMADACIEFKQELFYGDTVKASIQPAAYSKIGFELFYKLEKTVLDKTILVALAKTGMICYDYEKKKISNLPEAAKKKLIA